MDLTHKTRHAVLAIGAAGALVVVGGGFAAASYSGVSSSGQILACSNPGAANLRIVDHFPCKPGETPLAWNQKGVKGDPGLAGTKGDAGAAGAAGANGTSGTGTAGETGATGARGLKGDTGATGLTGEQGLPGTPGTPGAQGATGPAGADGAGSRTSSGIYDYRNGCGDMTSVPDVAPTKNGVLVPPVGQVTETSPGVFHLSGLTAGTSYYVYACGVGSASQTAADDGTADVVLHDYNGFDVNGVALSISYTLPDGSYHNAATLVLTAPPAPLS